MSAAIGEKAKKWKMLKHFVIEVRDDGMRYHRNQVKIETEAKLDGI